MSALQRSHIMSSILQLNAPLTSQPLLYLKTNLIFWFGVILIVLLNLEVAQNSFFASQPKILRVGGNNEMVRDRNHRDGQISGHDSFHRCYPTETVLSNKISTVFTGYCD